MPKKIKQIILLGFLLRLLAVLFLSDFTNDYFWEYGETAKNIINGNGYSLFYMENSKLEHHYIENVRPAESAYMPPGYVYFLVPFMLIGNMAIRNLLIYLLQIIIASLSIYLIYLLTKKIFDETTALIAALISAVLPEFIYAVLSFSPTVIYHALIILLLILLTSTKTIKNYYVPAAILIAIIIYFRSEFVLFYLLVIAVLLFQRQFKLTIKILIIVFVLIVPWSIRNYIVFEEVIPLSTSFGLNLFRGNNAEEIGSWGDDETEAKITALGTNNLELEVNKIYQDKAFSFIKENPIKVVTNAFVKLHYFWVYYPNDQRSLNLVYLIPSLILLLLFIFGIVSSFDWNKFQFLYLFFFFSSLTVMIFFPMARYQTMMKIGMIPFCAYGLARLSEKYKSALNR